MQKNRGLHYAGLPRATRLRQAAYFGKNLRHFLVQKVTCETVLNFTFWTRNNSGKRELLGRNLLFGEQMVPPKKLPLPGVIPGPESEIQHRLARTF